MSVELVHHHVKLELPNGDSACVALLGATVYSYISGGKQRLFHSSKSSIEGPSAIRGGIPICWPIFGPPAEGDALTAKLKQHGFARTSTWNYVEQAPTADGSAKAVFTLSSSPETTALFSPTFNLTYTVNLTPGSLQCSLTVDSPNDATEPLRFQALLHSYFRLADEISPNQVQVSPFKGLKISDKAAGHKESTEEREVVTVDGPGGEVDRVYFQAPDELIVKYDGHSGGLKLVKRQLEDAVLWNPGPEKAAAIGDMEDNGEEQFFCLEPGQIFNPITLNKGESWNGSIDLSFTD